MNIIAKSFLEQKITDQLTKLKGKIGHIVDKNPVPYNLFSYYFNLIIKANPKTKQDIIDVLKIKKEPITASVRFLDFKGLFFFVVKQLKDPKVLKVMVTLMIPGGATVLIVTLILKKIYKNKNKEII